MHDPTLLHPCSRPPFPPALPGRWNPSCQGASLRAPRVLVMRPLPRVWPGARRFPGRPRVARAGGMLGMPPRTDRPLSRGRGAPAGGLLRTERGASCVPGLAELSSDLAPSWRGLAGCPGGERSRRSDQEWTRLGSLPALAGPVCLLRPCLGDAEGQNRCP